MHSHRPFRSHALKLPALLSCLGAAVAVPLVVTAPAAQASHRAATPASGHATATRHDFRARAHSNGRTRRRLGSGGPDRLCRYLPDRSGGRLGDRYRLRRLRRDDADADQRQDLQRLDLQRLRGDDQRRDDGQDPIGVVVDEATHTVYAVNAGTNSVAVLNAATCNALVTSGCSAVTLVSVPGGPEFLALDTATDTVYVADTDSGEVSVIDGKTCNASVQTGCSHPPASVDAGAGAFPIAVDEVTNTVYVGTNQDVAVIDGTTCDSLTTKDCSHVAAHVPVNNEPAGIAIDDADHTAYVSGESGSVAVISTTICSGRHTAGCSATPRAAAVGSDPRGDLFDPATDTVYVTNVGSNTVSLLDASVCSSSATKGCASGFKTFPLGDSPRRLAIDAATHTLYVVNTGDGTASVIDEATCNADTTTGCPTQSPPGTGGGAGGAGGGGGSGYESNCSPTSGTAPTSGAPRVLKTTSTEVTHGTVDGKSWSLWSKNGQSGATGLEEGSVVVGASAYGDCPGFPNPAELELLDAGSHGIVYGVVGYPGKAQIQLSVGTAGTFTEGAGLPTPKETVVKGVSFFIGVLPKSACDYASLELDTSSGGLSSQHNLGFGACHSNSLVPITTSMGDWDG